MSSFKKSTGKKASSKNTPRASQHKETEHKATAQKPEKKPGFFGFWRKNKTQVNDAPAESQPNRDADAAPRDTEQKSKTPSTRFAALKNKPGEAAQQTKTVKEALDYVALKKSPTVLPGSEGEHELQEKFDTKQRAMNFYSKQVLSFLAPEMQKFIEQQEFLFVSTADAKGECDCTSKLGEAGFIRVLNEKYLMYPEYRGNGVYANLGNISENPHIGLLIMDFYKDTIGLHINGKARIVENEELLQFKDNVPASVIDEITQDSKKRLERWVMVEVEEAYVQCSKHIPLLQKLDKKRDWGTDSEIEKKVDYFQLHDIPLYDRLGGDKAMEIVVDHFYRKVLKDEQIAHFFEDVDMDAQRQKQKGFLSYAFGGPYVYTGKDMRVAHEKLVKQMGLSEQHFDHLMGLLKETFHELGVADKEIKQVLALLESARDDVLCR